MLMKDEATTMNLVSKRNIDSVFQSFTTSLWGRVDSSGERKLSNAFIILQNCQQDLLCFPSNFNDRYIDKMLEVSDVQNIKYSGICFAAKR